MTITINHNHYFHGVDNDVKDLLHLILKKLNIMGAELDNLKAQNEALLAAVAEEDTVIDSAVTLITGFATTLSTIQQQLADAIANNDPAALQTVADSIGGAVTDINSRKEALAAAVTANTPSA